MKAPDPAKRPGGRRPIERLLTPLQRFAELEASGGIVLILSTLAALVWANWGAAHSYDRFFHTPVTVGFGDWLLSKSLQHWINDGLMAIFFFVVGLEIKRELLIGELATFRKAALPVAGALGGMVAPALLYLSLNAGTAEVSGWGVPMATDIAFVIGALTLLGSRAPSSLKVFLVALAIVDDMGAVLVIALFYTASISLLALYAAAAIFIVLLVLSGLGTRSPLIYSLLGVALWLALLNSGIHATIAGILLALTVPASTRIGTDQLISRGRELLDKLERAERSEPTAPTTEEEQNLLAALEAESERAETPMQRLARTLHPWSVFMIMPVFALANAGVPLDAGAFSVTSLGVGVFLGLVLGKPLGISLFAWIAVRSRVAALGEGVTMWHVIGAGCLGGIGFTMSIFIATLAFDDQALNLAKSAILVSSLVAALLGGVTLYGVTRRRPAQG
jgi:NhaA family Na+:H+ antiporter